MSILLLLSIILNIIGWTLLITVIIITQLSDTGVSDVPIALLIIAVVCFATSFALGIVHAAHLF